MDVLPLWVVVLLFCEDGVPADDDLVDEVPDELRDAEELDELREAEEPDVLRDALEEEEVEELLVWDDCDLEPLEFLDCAYESEDAANIADAAMAASVILAMVFIISKF